MENYDLRNVKLVENRLFTRDGKRYLYLRYENQLPSGDVCGVSAEVALDNGLEGYVKYCDENYPFGLRYPSIAASGISFNTSTWETFYKEAPAKEMTLADLEKQLGHKIKIVSK